jgi:hypothetical protein
MYLRLGMLQEKWNLSTCTFSFQRVRCLNVFVLVLALSYRIHTKRFWHPPVSCFDNPPRFSCLILVKQPKCTLWQAYQVFLHSFQLRTIPASLSATHASALEYPLCSYSSSRSETLDALPHQNMNGRVPLASKSSPGSPSIVHLLFLVSAFQLFLLARVQLQIINFRENYSVFENEFRESSRLWSLTPFLVAQISPPNAKSRPNPSKCPASSWRINAAPFLLVAIIAKPNRWR